MFSSTMVATSARRDWISQETGNSTLRIRTLAMKINGMAAMPPTPGAR